MPRIGRVRGRSSAAPNPRASSQEKNKYSVYVSAKTDMGNGLSQSLALLVCCHIKDPYGGDFRFFPS